MWRFVSKRLAPAPFDRTSPSSTPNPIAAISGDRGEIVVSSTTFVDGQSLKKYLARSIAPVSADETCVSCQLIQKQLLFHAHYFFFCFFASCERFESPRQDTRRSCRTLFQLSSIFLPIIAYIELRIPRSKYRASALAGNERH